MGARSPKRSFGQTSDKVTLWTPEGAVAHGNAVNAGETKALVDGMLVVRGFGHWCSGGFSRLAHSYVSREGGRLLPAG